MKRKHAQALRQQPKHLKVICFFFLGDYDWNFLTCVLVYV